MKENKKKTKPNRKTWAGLYVRKTPTKRELEMKIQKKHPKRGFTDE